MKVLTSLILFCASGLSLGSEVPHPDIDWRLVAQSHIIVTGTLEVPVKQIRSSLQSDRPDYVSISVTRNQTIKGNPPERFVVRWFTKSRSYSPQPERVISFHDKRALLFLVHVDDADVKGYYFSGHSPLALKNPLPDQLQRIEREVARQKELLANFSRLFPASEMPHYEKVKILIDSTTRKESQTAAFQRLEELGPAAVPAIITLMDDRRDLAIPAISLENKSPDAFEGTRHYGPNKVVDAMAAILNQITGHSFGTIYNSGSERERQATVDGWRVYLHHMKNQPHNKSVEDNGHR